MNKIIEKDDIKIENMIYEVRGKQVMLSIELSAIKYHGYFYDKIVTHYDIGKQISVFNNFIIKGER